MSQKASSAQESGVKPDATGGGQGPAPAVSYTFSVLYSFTGGADGGGSYSGVVLDAKGNLYGTAESGGTNYGTVWELTP